MIKNKILLLLIFLLLLSSCGGTTWEGVKRGMTGGKEKGGDEFLVRKKDPLILPPDYENLPVPDETILTEEESEYIEKKLKKEIFTEKDSSVETSSEKALLEKIKSK